MIKAGIIGCGTIGGVIADAVVRRFSDAIKLLGVCDVDEEKARKLLEKLKANAAILNRDELAEQIEKTFQETEAGQFHSIEQALKVTCSALHYLMGQCEEIDKVEDEPEPPNTD